MQLKMDKVKHGPNLQDQSSLQVNHYMNPPVQTTSSGAVKMVTKKMTDVSLFNLKKTKIAPSSIDEGENTLHKRSRSHHHRKPVTLRESLITDYGK